MNSKQKATIIIIITLTLLLSFACRNVDSGDPTATPAVDEACWQRVYNECVDAGNGIWTCNDLANTTCAD